MTNEVNSNSAAHNADDARLAWAAWYVSLGWKVFVLAADASGGKVPTRNCARCDTKSYDGHDRESCPCLLCHGFYAATDDLDRVAAMVRQLPNGFLAVRTGRASGVIVLDVENKTRKDERGFPQPTGVELLEQWETLNGWDLPRTLVSRSVSGGSHLFFLLPPGVDVRSRDLEPEAIEVKSDGRCVAVPCGRNSREWLDTSVPVAEPPPQLLGLLDRARTRRGDSGGGTAGNAGGDAGPLPDTDEFLVRGLGWFTGSRNRDAYRLACRLWSQDHGESEVERLLRDCWAATADQRDSSWTEQWRTALSARQGMDEARARELAEARAFLEVFRGTR